jgi:hypothetical protein
LSADSGQSPDAPKNDEGRERNAVSWIAVEDCSQQRIVSTNHPSLFARDEKPIRNPKV